MLQTDAARGGDGARLSADGSGMYLKTKALVLRSVDYHETDCILTVLTGEQGLLTLKARGVRRKSSELKAACQLLAYSEFTVFENRGYHTINEAVPIEQFTQLRRDLEQFALASYFAQLAEVLSQQDQPDGEVLSLTLNAFYALSKLGRPQAIVKAAYELRMIALAGYEPQLTGCAVCANETPDRFDVISGTCVCASCGRGGLCLPLSGGSLAAMRYILTCEAKKLYSFSLAPQEEKELSDIAQTYLLTQLERGFSALDFYQSLRLI